MIAVIRSFKNAETEALFAGRFSRRLQQLARVAQRKLQQVHAARELRDLSAFPGNRLEALADDRRRQHSIRVNDQVPHLVCLEGRRRGGRGDRRLSLAFEEQPWRRAADCRPCTPGKSSART